MKGFVRKTLLIGDKTDSTYYAKDDSRDAVFKLKEDLLKKLDIDPQKVRDKKLVRVDRAQVTSHEKAVRGLATRLRELCLSLRQRLRFGHGFLGERWAAGDVRGTAQLARAALVPCSGLPADPRKSCFQRHSLEMG